MCTMKKFSHVVPFLKAGGGGGKTDPNNLDKKKKKRKKKGKFQLHKNRENPNPCAGKCTIYHFLSIF